MAEVIRTAVQDRRRFVREGLSLVLRDEPDLDVVGTAADAAGLVELCRLQRPDAVVLELDADGWDAPRLAAALRRQRRTLRVVGTYETLSIELAQRAMKAGVRAAIAHPAGCDGVVAALRARDRMPLVSTIARPGPRREAAGAPLTPREIEVLTLIADGHTAAEAADLLGISPKTVENRKQGIFAKLEVQNQAHAVARRAPHRTPPPQADRVRAGDAMGVDVAVRGRPGMLHDLVVRLVETHDLTNLVGDPDGDVTAVVVLVDPEQWSTEGQRGERFIVMRSRLDQDTVLEDLRTGADAVFGPDVASEDFVTAVQVVSAGGCWLSPALTRQVVDALRRQDQDDAGPELTRASSTSS